MRIISETEQQMFEILTRCQLRNTQLVLENRELKLGLKEATMRINVYNEELTNEFEFTEKFVQETGKTYYGFRIFLKSAPELHHTSQDDDRSAITIWFGDKVSAAGYLRRATAAAENKFGG